MKLFRVLRRPMLAFAAVAMLIPSFSALGGSGVHAAPDSRPELIATPSSDVINDRFVRLAVDADSLSAFPGSRFYVAQCGFAFADFSMICHDEVNEMYESEGEFRGFVRAARDFGPTGQRGRCDVTVKCVVVGFVVSPNGVLGVFGGSVISFAPGDGGVSIWIFGSPDVLDGVEPLLELDGADVTNECVQEPQSTGSFWRCGGLADGQYSVSATGAPDGTTTVGRCDGYLVPFPTDSINVNGSMFGSFSCRLSVSEPGVTVSLRPNLSDVDIVDAAGNVVPCVENLDAATPSKSCVGLSDGVYTAVVPGAPDGQTPECTQTFGFDDQRSDVFEIGPETPQWSCFGVAL